ncbi:MAG TPA: hypothetical protein VK039_06140 [Brevibacterium sp.]|nr:hypothetical protein [Brevibacterium sp.]
MFKTSKVTLRTAQRHLGARDLLDAYEILWAAEVRTFETDDLGTLVDARELEELLQTRSA